MLIPMATLLNKKLVPHPIVPGSDSSFALQFSLLPALSLLLSCFLSLSLFIPQSFSQSSSLLSVVLSCPYSASSLLSAPGCTVVSSICLDILPPSPLLFLSLLLHYFHPLCFCLSDTLCSFFSIPQTVEEQTYWELAALSNGDILTQCY